MSFRSVPVSRSDDPRIAPYTSIREKDLTRGHAGRFIVEGKVTLETLIRRARFRPESVLVETGRLQPLAPLLADVPHDVPIYTADQAIMDQIVGFPIHRGVLACGLKSEPLVPHDLIRQARTLLVLIGLSNHDNVGACFRNAAAFGVDAILLDETCCDPLYRKSIRVSAGTALTLPFTHGASGTELLSILSQTGTIAWCLTPDRQASPLTSLTRPERLALVLGAEGPGLPDNLIAAGQAVRIPMATNVDSLNVATAGAIALSHVQTVTLLSET